MSGFFAVLSIFFIPSTVFATTTTVLLSENFSEAQFPPLGWTCSRTGQNFYYGGWYRSSGGNGGVGGNYGSAVAFTYYAYQKACCSNCYDNGTITMMTPAITTSNLTSADSVFVDFDLWFPYNYYENYYSTSYNKLAVKVMVGTTTLMTQTNNQDFYSGTTGYTDPSSRSSSIYWKHYHVAVPYGTSTTSITFQVGDNGSNCAWGYMRDENVAITNVVVSDVRYTALTLNGPSTINFGLVPAFASVGPFYTSFTNNSSVPISLTGYSITGLDSTDFSVVRFPSVIPVGGSDSIGILYTPQGGGSRLAQLNVTTSADIPQSFSVALEGIGLVPNVSYSATSLFRGTNTELDSGSKSQYLYVRSTGGVALNILSASFTGLDSNAYAITHYPQSSIPVGTTDSIGIQFLPDIEGLPDARLVINSTAANNPSDTVQLFGVGILPHLSLSSPLPNVVSNENHAMVVAFDSVLLGADSCLSITLTNPGSDTLAIEHTFFASHDFDFSLSPFSGAQDTLIPPGGTAQLQVCFAPLQRGYRTATVELQTNIPFTQTNPVGDTGEFYVQFIGEGVPTGDLSVDGPSNGSIAVGTQSCVMDTLWNTGAADVSVSTISISGMNAAVFAANGVVTPFTIPAGGSILVDLCATPTDTGTQTGILTAAGMAGEKLVQTTFGLSVYGTSIDDTVLLPQFANTCIGTSDTETVTIKNTGNIAQRYQLATGNGTTDFTVLLPNTSDTIAAGGSADFQVVFTPSGNGSKQGSLLITGGKPLAPVSISAIGEASAIAGDTTGPTTAIGETSQPFIVTVNNTGSCFWNPGTTVLSSDPEFTYVPGTLTPIAGGSSEPLEFTFAPTQAGNRSATISFPNATGTSIPAVNVTVNAIAASAGVAEVATSNGFILGQNSPNPFAGTSSVELTLPEPARVHLEIVNMTGKLVETVLDRQFDAGTYSVSLDASQFVNGTYYYEMTADGVTLSQKMVVMK